MLPRSVRARLQRPRNSEVESTRRVHPGTRQPRGPLGLARAGPETHPANVPPVANGAAATVFDEALWRMAFASVPKGVLIGKFDDITGGPGGRRSPMVANGGWSVVIAFVPEPRIADPGGGAGAGASRSASMA